MYRVFDCIVSEHDLRFVLAAGLVCILSTAIGFDLLSRAHKSEGRARLLWLLAASLVVGLGTWATHFIAILAYTVDAQIGFSVEQTVASAVAGICIGGSGLAILAYEPKAGWASVLAGMIIGLGIAVLHYVGVMAVAFGGVPRFDPALIIASLALAALFGGASGWVFARAQTGFGRLCAALLLTLAILSHHFTGMASVEVVSTVASAVSSAEAQRSSLAVWISAAMIGILILGFVGALFDRVLARRSLAEARRLKALSDAAFEGILICRGGVVDECNASFGALLGWSGTEIVGRSLTSFFSGESDKRQIVAMLEEARDGSLEATLKGSADEHLPVELLVRHVEDAGARLSIVAIRDLRERREAEARIRFLAHHDNLTGCANRGFFTLRLEEEIRHAGEAEHRIALHYLDLDHFKEVNDTLGHPVGDEVLKAVVRRIGELVRKGDLVGRIGGDEFVVAQVGNPDAEEAIVLAERIVSALARPIAVEDHEITIGVSVGVALFPGDGRTAEDLVQSADMALYRSKREGRGGYRTFESEMGDRLRERRAIQKDLAEAIRTEQLTLAYQPQVRVATRETIGFEALVRWHHPERGNIPPSTFIPLAEEAGLIGGLGDWVLRTACREAAGWDQPLGISVNLSPCQIIQCDVPTLVHEVLLETGLDPTRLELEITEGVLIQDLNRALDTLRRIKALGVRIAMDDFGTGYSSLSYLQSFPFDKIKIDRSFIDQLGRNEHSLTIVRAVLAIGKGLGVAVVAEGVETDSQLAVLAGEACEEVQGYLTGRPGPIETFRAVVDGVAGPGKVGLRSRAA